jgi:hypothetical protein
VAVSGPSSAVFIACYECSKNAIEKVAATFPPPLASIQNIAPILAAAFGNLAASTVRVPPEVIKQRVQAGLYRCVSSNVFVHSKISFVNYQQWVPIHDPLHEHALTIINMNLISLQEISFCGRCLVKRNRICGIATDQNPPPPPLLFFCRDVLQAIKAIWVNEGFSGFYCGYSLQVNSLILINQKVSCGLELDLHAGLSKSLEISAKLLIWLTDSECR